MTFSKHLGIFAVLVALFVSSPSLAANRKYKAALKENTRTQETYQREDFYASLKWTVTYLKPEFVDVTLGYMSEFYDSSAADQNSKRFEWQKRFHDTTAFYVSFYGYDFNHSDLSNKNGDWEIFLLSDGKRYNATKIEKVGKPSPLEMRLFPYTNLWARHFYVYFPEEAGRGSKIELRVVGPQGNGSLIWK